MIVYGDSRMKLLDSLGVDDSAGVPTSLRRHGTTLDVQDAAQYERPLKRLRKFTPSGQPIHPMQASVRSTRKSIDIQDHPFCRAAHQRKERNLEVAEEEFALELRQINGLRYWQLMKHNDDGFTGLPDSPLLRNLESNQRLRHRVGIRGTQLVDDSSRVVGHWRVPILAGRNFNQLLETLDSQSIKNECLAQVIEHEEVNPLGPRELRRLTQHLTKRAGGRVLLLLHDALGSTKQMIESFGPDFLRRADREYVAVLGFDHWSLRQRPDEIADQLRDQLGALLGVGPADTGSFAADISVDVVGLGRGGLVARMLVEEAIEDTAKKIASTRRLIRNVALVGTPSFGSRLAKPSCWGLGADLLANSMHLDESDYYGQMSAALAQISALKEFHDGRDLASRASSLLLTDAPQAPLRPPDGINYFAIAATFAPVAEVTALRILFDCNADSAVQAERPPSNSLLQPSDLIVATDDVYSRTRRRALHADNEEADIFNDELGDVTSEPTSRIRWNVPTLLIEPNDRRFYSKVGPLHSKANVDASRNVERRRHNGVHHAGLLSHPECQNFLLQKLVGERQS